MAHQDEVRIKSNKLLHAEAIVWVNSFHLSHEGRRPTAPEFCRTWGKVLLDYLVAERRLILQMASSPGTEPLQEVIPYNGRD